VELAPGDASAVREAVQLARILGRIDDGVELIRRAIALDPVSATTRRQAGMVYLLADRLDEAAASFQAAIDLAPNAGLFHAFLAITRMFQGRVEEAIPISQSESHDVFRNLALALIHHTLGHPEESEAALKVIVDEFAWTAAYQIAEVYAFRKETDKSFEWLERAYVQRDSGAAYSATDPLLQALHNDPRWGVFLRKMGLAD